MKFDNITNQIYIVAINEAKLQMHEYVTPEHFLYSSLMFDAGRDIIESSGGYATKIASDLQRFFDTHISKIETEPPMESFAFSKLFEIAATIATGSSRTEITIGDILAALMSLPECFGVYILNKNGVDKLSLLKYISYGQREKQLMKNLAAGETKARQKNKGETNENPHQKKDDTDYLRMFAIDLTDRARKGLLDPIIGREDVLARTIQVLCRRVKNNPIHVGDAGVGKTAISEGLAQKIASGNVPDTLKDAVIYDIDMGSVVAGTKYRGDFEERMIKILDAAANIKNAIIYLDEIHNIIGAGGSTNGAMDAISILKPYLSQGRLRFVGATTYDEYKKYIEKDSALTRRFQKIDISEPSIDEATEILNGIKHKYEEFHQVAYSKEIIHICCKLAEKHLFDRKLPDNAIDVMDETGSFLRMNAQTSEKVEITPFDIERTVAQMASIPVKSVSQNEINQLKELEKLLKEHIYGQDNAVHIVSNAIKASRSGLNDSEKPVASFLFVGPTGVGKTELAKQLANLLHVKLLRFDMSEYQEQHSVARLIGSPPGYVGYEEGGLLTDSIRKTPYCILLLDEIEKAHSDVFNVLLQVMDYGVLTDNTGKKADFRNVVIIMTSNAGARELGKRIIGFDDKKVSFEAVDRAVEQAFSPEFRNRLDEIVSFRNIDMEMAVRITKKALSQLSLKLEEKSYSLYADEEVINFIAKKGFSHEYGAREIMRVVNKDIKKLLVDMTLFGGLSDGGIAVVSLKDGIITIEEDRSL